MDTFIIEVESSFLTSGRFGGANVNVFGNNIQYNMINVSGQYMNYGQIDSWIFSGYNVDGSLDKNYNILPSHEVDLDTTNIVFSDNNETRVIGKDNDSINVTINLNSNNRLLSHVFNIDSFSATLITNRVEAIDQTVYGKLPIGPLRYVAETIGNSGVESYKYVSTRVLLENPAVDMKILLSVHCQTVADFDIYVKLISAQNVNKDDSTIDWVKVDNYTKKYSTLDKNDYSEYSLLLSENMTSYNNSIEYIAFRVKIVGRSKNKATPPLFKDFRAIAVT